MNVTQEMIDRFLRWQLPEHFSPDAGVSFKPTKPDGYGTHWWPIGTNLFTADQTRQMLGFVLAESTAAQVPPLHDGEKWAGIVTTEKGLHHIILLPGDQDEATWKKQMAWAKKAGGDLPDRVELATLRRTLPDEFKPDWYWSNEQRAADSDYAWFQDFYDGSQDLSSIFSKLRARAVRRVVI